MQKEIYRLLEQGETIIAGDEFRARDEWHKAGDGLIGNGVASIVVRRKMILPDECELITLRACNQSLLESLTQAEKTIQERDARIFTLERSWLELKKYYDEAEQRAAHQFVASEELRHMESSDLHGAILFPTKPVAPVQESAHDVIQSLIHDKMLLRTKVAELEAHLHGKCIADRFPAT